MLFARHPDDAEVKLLEAELNIAAEDYAAARKALGDLPETAPTARSLTIMAAIERGEGSEDRVVRGWLAKAVTASRGPQWTCEACGHVHANWQPVCEQCESFDTLAWIEAPQSKSALAGTAQMLPLIVGALEDRSNMPEVEATVVEDAPAPDAEPVIVDVDSEAEEQDRDPHAPGHMPPDMGEVSEQVESEETPRATAN